jgi:hypothetical protein
MKALIISLAALGALALSVGEEARAHRPHGVVRSHVSVGFGYPYYRPYPYYPRTWVGISVWPQQFAGRNRKGESTASAGAHQLYVYPAAGQSERRLADDRYDCHVWSVEQTDFDPTLGAGTRSEADEYARAMTACLEARGYVVR